MRTNSSRPNCSGPAISTPVFDGLAERSAGDRLSDIFGRYRLDKSGHRQVVCLGVVLPGLVVVAIATRYKDYRYPIEVIGHAVWLYHRFVLSLGDVEELMLARGVAVT